MEQIQPAEFPVAIHLIDELQNIRGPVLTRIVRLNVCSSFITPIPSHTLPEIFNGAGGHRGGASHEYVEMPPTCRLPTARKPLLIASHIPDITSKGTLKAVDEFRERLVR